MISISHMTTIQKTILVVCCAGISVIHLKFSIKKRKGGCLIIV